MSNERKNENILSSYHGLLWKWDKRNAYIEYKNDIPVHINNKRVDSPLSKASVVEILLLKYLIPVILVYFLFSFNMYYPALLGAALGICFYAFLRWVMQKYSKQTMYVTALILPFTYFIARWVAADINDIYNTGPIFSKSLEFVLWTYLFHKVVLDVFAGKLNSIYKVNNYLFQYIIINNDSDKGNNKRKKEKATKYFFAVAILFSLTAFAIGGSQLLIKYTVNKEVERKLKSNKKIQETENDREKRINRLARLDIKAEEYGIDTNYHRANLDIEDYVKIRMKEGQLIIRVSDREQHSYPYSTGVVTGTVKKIWDKSYRYHIMIDNAEYYINTVKAR